MALTVSSGGGTQLVGGVQGSSPSLQGSNPSLQGSSPSLQGSSPNLQPAVSPVGASFASQPSNTATTTAQTPAEQAQAAAAAAAAATQAKINSLITQGTNSAQAAGAAGDASGKQAITTLGSNAEAAIGAQQNAIDEARAQAGATQISSIRQLQNTIKNGLQGTGVQLGNSGALSSSAADAAARAYAQYGDVQTNAANNTAADANAAQDVQQNDLSLVMNADKTQLDSARDAAITSITSQAQDALDTLETQITYLGGDPNSVQSQTIKAQIVKSAQDDLDQVDQNYQNLLGAINPASTDQTSTQAETLANAGTVGASESPYQLSSTQSASSALQPSDPTQTGASVPSLIPLGVANSSKTDPNSLIPAGS